jgi:hypothetical protein
MQQQSAYEARRMGEAGENRETRHNPFSARSRSRLKAYDDDASSDAYAWAGPAVALRTLLLDLGFVGTSQTARQTGLRLINPHS